MKQTAVEWLVEQITNGTMSAREAIQQAKEMELDQRKNDYRAGWNDNKHKDKALSQIAVSSCFCVVDEKTGHYESIHQTLESAEKEITDWKRFKPSKDVIIVEREFIK